VLLLSAIHPISTVDGLLAATALAYFDKRVFREGVGMAHVRVPRTK